MRKELLSPGVKNRKKYDDTNPSHALGIILRVFVRGFTRRNVIHGGKQFGSGRHLDR